MMSAIHDIRIDDPDPRVRLITLDRPGALNALRRQCLHDIAAALDDAAADEAIHCVVITGGDRVFAAGADIKEMAALDTVAVLLDERVEHWATIRRFRKPLIAAVNGYALGGGCELALCTDIIVAGETARFGQPEINLGIIPGGGGTQRLIRAVGKSLAMKMVLSGERIDARTALAAGLVSDVTPPELTVERALAIARSIARKPPLAARLAKQMLLESYEVPLEAGLAAERQAFTVLAATEDRNEGIAAFIEKRKPDFKGR